MTGSSRHNISRKGRQQGFTLIEIAIVVMITGILIAPFFAIYMKFRQQSEVNVTHDNLQEISAQISYFLSINSRYPCPADPSLPRGDPNYGREINATCDPVLLGVAQGTCAMGKGFCYVDGVRDTDADGDAANDPVVIGAVPIITLRETTGVMVSTDRALDGWGSRLTYAISRHQALAADFRHGNGVIRAVNEFGNPTSGIKDDADFTLVSHGPNKNGAHNQTGALTEDCGLLSNGLDNQNCNNDAIFVQALISKAPGGSRFDDYTYFGKSYNSALWNYISGTQHIRNLNAGNIGVGLDNPSQLLDVAGTIANDNTTRVDRICSKTDPAACFDVDAITGSGIIACAPGDVMVGIGDVNGPNPAICVTPVFSALVPNQYCGGLNEWIVGFKSNGDIICKVP